MPTLDDIRQDGTPFDPFLYASVGEDRTGASVTVLSALARLGLDPWGAAAELSQLSRDAARTRLGGLLAQFYDVPALGRDHDPVSRQLIDLLPSASSAGRGPGVDLSAHAGPMRMGAVLAILMVVLVLVQSVFLGSTGAGP